MTMKTRTYRRLFAALAMSVVLVSSASVQAHDFHKGDVEIAVDLSGRGVVPSSGPVVFDVWKWRAPASERDLGFACGEVVDYSRESEINKYHSFNVALYDDGGRLTASAMAIFHMPVEELLKEKVCR